MNYENKTRKQLVHELARMHQRIAELETVKAKHKWTEKTLREIEEKWRPLYESLPGGSFIVNDQYTIEEVNDVLCALTGFAREELVGQSCDIICPKGPHKCPIFDVGKERLDNDETAVKTKDGRLVPIVKSVRRIPAMKNRNSSHCLA